MMWVVRFAMLFHVLCTRFRSLAPLFQNTLRIWLLQVSFSYYLYMMYIYRYCESSLYYLLFSHQFHGILSSRRDMGFHTWLWSICLTGRIVSDFSPFLVCMTIWICLYTTTGIVKLLHLFVMLHRWFGSNNLIYFPS